MVAMLMFLDVMSESLKLKQEVTALDSDIKFRKFMRANRAKFDPDQPHDELGRWTDGTGELENGGENYRSSSSILLAAGRKQPVAWCWNQIQIDMLLCSAVQPASRRAVCRSQANQRYGACLAGTQIPPLSY